MSGCLDTIELERPEDGITIARFRDGAGLGQLPDLRDLFPLLDRDPSTRVLLLTGDGERFFGGPTLDEIAEMRADPARVMEEMATARHTLRNIIDFEKPIVAAVNGPAIGVGTTVALLCDFVVASETAEFRDPHVLIGVPPGDGGVLIWPLLLGLSRSKRHLMLAERLSAPEAAELGVVTEVVEASQTVQSGLQIARRLLAMPPHALHATKAALNQLLRAASLNAGDYAMALQLAAQLGPEADATIRRLAARERER